MNKELKEILDQGYDFFNSLDEFIKPKYKKTLESIKELKLSITDITLKVEVSQHFGDKFKLNENLTFGIDINSRRVKVLYFYKDLPVEPITYYVTPNNYVTPPTLLIMQEAIIQDTYAPDIHQLVDKLASMNEKELNLGKLS